VSESEEIIFFRGSPYGQLLSKTRRVRLGYIGLAGRRLEIADRTPLGRDTISTSIRLQIDH